MQRSLSYVLGLPQPGDNSTPPLWQRILPQRIVLKWDRFLFTLGSMMLYSFCIYFPTRASSFLRNEAKKHLPADFPTDPHFKPAYNPWEQRLCLCPDGDFFKCLHSGCASIVSDTIQSVVSDGIPLNSGEKLDADIIIIATGLSLRFLGGIALAVDGVPVDVPKEYTWHFAMLSNVPNMGQIIGYWNASWTLGSDTASRLFTRVIRHMHDNGYTAAIPTIPDEERKDPRHISPLSSTYVEKVENTTHKCGKSGPWAPRQFYSKDSWKAEVCDLNDGMRFEEVST